MKKSRLVYSLGVLAIVMIVIVFGFVIKPGAISGDSVEKCWDDVKTAMADKDVSALSARMPPMFREAYGGRLPERIIADYWKDKDSSFHDVYTTGKIQSKSQVENNPGLLRIHIKGEHRSAGTIAFVRHDGRWYWCGLAGSLDLDRLNRYAN